MIQKILVAAATLMVTRDAMTILPVTVPAHEVEVMQALHGEENVQLTDEKTDPVELEAAAEGERLLAKYGPETMEKAFGANFKTKVAKAVAEHQVKPAKASKQAEAA